MRRDRCQWFDGGNVADRVDVTSCRDDRPRGLAAVKVGADVRSRALSRHKRWAFVHKTDYPHVRSLLSAAVVTKPDGGTGVDASDPWSGPAGRHRRGAVPSLMRVSSQHPGRVVTAIARLLDLIWVNGTRARRAVRGVASARRFAAHGDNFAFDPDGVYTYETIEVGRNVDLGHRPVIMAARSRIRIGDNVMFGPEVTIRGGNHRIDRLGVPMISVEKCPTDGALDRGVTIGDDVWVGTRAVILHGVTIGRGAVIGAGAVVTRPVPPYAIAAGNPARVIRLRWPVEAIVSHEEQLYPPERRLAPAELAVLSDLPGSAARPDSSVATVP
ncbi:acyltransferase [Micromonospora sp. C97]|uniref:acyltransferase n=1 Tax=Micromonospora sp. C97 TaxID=2824883 RepID=UPI0027DC5A4A|nr:acyltransferase [Micromonospora sp. C97]